MNQSETPRTNVAAEAISDWLKTTEIEVVATAFARTLERELAAAQKELAEVRKVAEDLRRAVLMTRTAMVGKVSPKSAIWEETQKALAAWEKLNQKQ